MYIYMCTCYLALCICICMLVTMSRMPAGKCLWSWRCQPTNHHKSECASWNMAIHGHHFGATPCCLIARIDQAVGENIQIQLGNMFNLCAQVLQLVTTNLSHQQTTIGCSPNLCWLYQGCSTNLPKFYCGRFLPNLFCAHKSLQSLWTIGLG